MLMTQLITKLGRSDAKIIGRDGFLIFMFIFAVIIAVALRFLLPWADGYLAENGIMPGPNIPIRFSEMEPMFVAYLALWTGALIVGTVFGFVLLDERDNNTLKAMLVTPVPLNQYVLYRVGGPAIFAVFVLLAMVYVINVELLPFWQTLLIVLGGSLAAPLVSLFFATFAENKVQGIAYSKFGGISGWAFLIGWFVPEPWQWLFGLFPPYWIGKAYWLAVEGRGIWIVTLLIGVVYHVVAINWFIKRFNKVAYR